MKNWAILAAIIAAFFWAGPRIYRPTYIGADTLDARIIWHYQRQWFGPTIMTRLEARRDSELMSIVWMAKQPDGTWWRFFHEPD